MSLLCLVGAGANPLVTTSELTQDLLDWKQFRDPTGAAEITGIIQSTVEDSRQPFYHWLDDRLPHLRARVGSPNFEDFIHLVEVVASNLGTVTKQTPWHRNFPTGFAGDLFAPTDLAQAMAPQNTAFVAEQSRLFILERVLEKIAANHCRTPSAELLAKLHNEYGSVLQVFSLNYDATITEALSIDWWTSYVRRDDGVGVFSPEVHLPCDKNIHIQLHGSIYFGLEFAGSDYDISRLRRYDKPDDARKSWGISTGADRAQDDHILPIVPMITGRRKADIILLEPFGTYYQYLRDAAMSTPRWLIIGYGGKDLHVNAALRTAAAKWGKDLRVVICNSLPDSSRVPNPEQESRERLFYITAARQEVGALLWDLFKPFPSDYYQFFKDRSLATKRYLWNDRGEFGRVLLTVDGNPLSRLQDIREWLAI